jgi:hypothetical protein
MLVPPCVIQVDQAVSVAQEIAGIGYFANSAQAAIRMPMIPAFDPGLMS